MDPLVSVLVPTKNSSKTIEECLLSIRDQTYKNIEVIVVDTLSKDDTIDIAKKYASQVINTEWKLLGARYLGFKACHGEYALLLDADHILFPDTIERLVELSRTYDMLCLEEEAFTPRSFLEKACDADRMLVNAMPELHIDPVEGVMLARFFKSSILSTVFDSVPMDKLHDLVFMDHAIIYYEAYKISSRVGILRKAVRHQEPSSIMEMCAKYYRHGKNARLLYDNGLYMDLLKKKNRVRKGMSLSIQSLKSLIVVLLKGVPYVVGAKIG